MAVVGQKWPHWNHLTKLWNQIVYYTPRGNIIKTKINLQPVRFRWTVCTKHKHGCLLESLPESRHPRLRKIKFSYHHRQNTDKEPTAYSNKPCIIYLREYLLHNSEFNYFVSTVNLIILFICEDLCEDIYLRICILTWLMKVQCFVCN